MTIELLSLKNRVPMLSLEVQITQDDCNELIFTDITPAYSPQNLGGYGGPNIEVENIVEAKITLGFGGQQFPLVMEYKQTDKPWIIYADDIPNPGSPVVVSDCATCDQQTINVYLNNRLQSLPSGCIDLKYDVYSEDLTVPSKRKLEGTKVIKYVSTCRVEKKFIEVVNNLTLPNADCGYDIDNTFDQKKLSMNYMVLAWQKLKLLSVENGCDCDCIAARIKQIDTFLSEVKY